MLPGRGERGRHLAHARILAAQKGVDLLQQFRLFLEGWRGDRVFVAVEMAVGAGGRCGQRAGIAALDRRDGIGGAQQRRFRKFARMRVAGRLAGDGAQAEALIGVEVGGLQPAVVEHQRFALAVFEIEFAVVGAIDRVGDDAANAIVGNVELIDEAVHGVSAFMPGKVSSPDVGAQHAFGNAKNSR